MTMPLHEEPPARAEAKAVMRAGFPCCGACGRRLAHKKQWRCPYVSCRAWLYGTDNPPKRDEEDHA